MLPASLAMVVVAAGRGSRAGEGLPKQYRSIGGEPILRRVLRELHNAAPSARLVVVIHPDDRAHYDNATTGLSVEIRDRLAAPVAGGVTRQASVLAGLEALAPESPTLVLIHDCARPFVTPALIARAAEAATLHAAAVPGLAVTDTIKQVDLTGAIVATPDRAALRAVQTPQAFRFDLILSAHRAAIAAGRDGMTDDGAVAEWAGYRVHVFDGDPGNMKVTTPQDFVMAEARISERLADVRTGQGFDVHAFTAGDHVCLGGIAVAHDKALLGHSDADVLMHAVTDALYGALADGDIGAHFPPSDPQWKGAASETFLRHAVARVRDRGGMIAHVDATVICEAPKVGPHRDRIRARLAQIMDIDVTRVAVKATTSEQLGFTGRREGIAAMALATVRLPG